MIEPVGDDFVKRYRLNYNLDALERVRGEIGDVAYLRLKALIEYRLHGRKFDRSPTGVKVVLAFSGGSDSTAALKILRWAGFDVIPVTARLPQMRGPVLLSLQREGAVFVDVPGYMEAMKRQIAKRAPICGRCHSMVMEAVEDYARKNGIKIVASGDLLSSGLISVYSKDGIVVLNLPAFLALDKGEAISTLGRKYALGFGCPLWRAAARESPILKKYGIQRVLRELRARAITPEMAERLILDVLSG